MGSEDGKAIRQQGVATLYVHGEEFGFTDSSFTAACDRNLHGLKITSRSRPHPPSSNSSAPSELYPFLFFLLRAHSNRCAAFLILVLYMDLKKNIIHGIMGREFSTPPTQK